MIDSTGKVEGDSDDDESEEDEEDGDEEELVGAVPLFRLRRHVEMYLSLEHLSKELGPEHPFLTAQEARVMQVKNTILLDLGTALKQARSTKVPNMTRIMAIMGLYRDLDEAKEALKVIKNDATRKVG
ncbi:hypothetical protein P152DRAFT_456985 [Eremomyces bilateralis CBS 781.70]|uniref:Uncharacterized protein n=1 Tax=Eremomyces bilateralis CBS 781.70 TaxID=1392243 RepID=A0A6G1G6F6_9PEZI|nr:uncharacterized protein P152DRAFT_456985 [Eremomyces bilateralis CBS 781.70]KAF1813602.1 hypothetical protein P152DRAFT_456985 [Eremomyces bilateralis CBS 781.70]